MVQFYSIGIIALLSAMSPGPDFVVISKHALSSSPRAGLFCALGIAAGILFHTSYCVMGLAIVISQSIIVFNIIKVLGALYLIYLGVKGLMARRPAELSLETKERSKTSAAKAFREGLLVNVLNPKCTLFILSIFTFVIEPQSSKLLQFGYGVEISIIAFIWFVFLTASINLAPIKSRMHRFQQRMSQVTGGLLVVLGLKILSEIFYY